MTILIISQTVIPPPEFSDLKWVTINIPNIEVNGDFYIAIFTYSDSWRWPPPIGGIGIGCDKDTKFGNSFVVVKNPNRLEEWPTNIPSQEDMDWMIRVLCTASMTFINTSGMEFVRIPAGEFDMGSPSDEVGRYDCEGPVHHVNIGKAFYMDRYEVTQKQWRAVMGDNPSCFTGDDDLPVECVSWDDVQEFIRKLNDTEGTTKYRLPSEAEWEYACRAGTTTRYSFGDDESELGDYAWYDDNSNDKTHPVGQKKPNPWGLYDMHGNVWEWVQDCWHSNYNGALADGSAWVYSCKYDGADRVYRGGGWFGDSRGCRSAIRDDRGCGCGVRCVDLGFRLVKEV